MGSKARGFTLVELSLAMTFLSMLLLAIAMLIIQLVHIYDRGVTLRAVSQAGQSVVSDIRNSLNQANPSNVKQISINGPRGGRLCTGTISYVWNYGKYNGSAGTPGDNAYSAHLPGGYNKYDVRFARFKDPGSNMCANSPMPLSPGSLDYNNATELLSSGDRDLAIQAFALTSHTVAGGSTTYHITLTLATNDQNALSGTQCKPPSDEGSNINFCAINTFDFTARAGGDN